MEKKREADMKIKRAAKAKKEEAHKVRKAAALARKRVAAKKALVLKKAR